MRVYVDTWKMATRMVAIKVWRKKWFRIWWGNRVDMAFLTIAFWLYWYGIQIHFFMGGSDGNKTSS